MSKNGLHRHYDKLSPEERFRLDVLAMARGDGQESERLVSSCPRFSYTMTDNAFSGLWLGAMDVTLRVYIEMAARLERLRMIGMMREVLPYQARYARERVRDAFVDGHRAGARQAWKAAGGEGSAPEWPHEGVDEGEVDRLAALGASVMPEILDRLERRQATEALTVWRGFGAFTDEALGVEPSKVLRAVFEPGAERIEDLEATGERLGLELDAEMATSIGAELLEAWNSVRRRAACAGGLRGRPAQAAANLEGLMGREGTIMGLFVGEDKILRGVRPRPGPPVEWNADGTVCG